MAIKRSERGHVDPFIVMDVMRKANEKEAKGGDIIHMEVGQPATAAPQRVIEAAQKALSSDKIGYTDALGIPPLREALSKHYQQTYGVSVAPNQIVVTTGSSAGFLLAFLAAFDKEDRVGLSAPGYPAYRNILKSLDLVPVEIPVGPENGFQPTPQCLSAISTLDGLILASPANPTGSMIHKEALNQLCSYCDQAKIRFISDEIYHGITYGVPAQTAFPFSPNVILVNSFSKYYSMTGWRIGWMVVPPDMVRNVECLAQNLFISAPTLSQYGALEALNCREELDDYVALYAKNREMLLNELPKAGFHSFAPSDGAFYLYGDVSHLCENSFEFCQKILDETGVAVTPGQDFDGARGHQFLRFSFAGDFDRLYEATQRLKTLT